MALRERGSAQPMPAAPPTCQHGEQDPHLVLNDDGLVVFKCGGTEDHFLSTDDSPEWLKQYDAHIAKLCECRRPPLHFRTDCPLKGGKGEAVWVPIGLHWED